MVVKKGQGDGSVVTQIFEYHREENEDKCMEMEEYFRLTDEDGKN